jgi:argininosuccinate synthase
LRAAAPLIIISISFSEKHTLGKWQQYWKEQLKLVRMLFHEGQFLDPVRNIEAFLEDAENGKRN